MRAVLAVALLLSGCTPSAEIIVEVHTDLEPDVDFDRAVAVSGVPSSCDSWCTTRSSDGRFEQYAEQPSPLVVLPSSHRSPLPRIPSPQTSVLTVTLNEPDAAAVPLPPSIAR